MYIYIYRSKKNIQKKVILPHSAGNISKFHGVLPGEPGKLMPRQRFRRETGRGARDEHGFLRMDRNQQKLTDKKSAAGFTACVYIIIYTYV
jgi:hypothetical protein